MNISREIFNTDGSNSSSYLFYNGTVEETGFKTFSIIDFITIIWGLPINPYVIWLIVTGTGNGLAAEFFNLNLAVCEIFICIESLLVLFSSTCKNLWIAVYFLDGLPLTGHPLFQCLMCVERYLAVVHPVTFLKYKPLRYKVICSVIVWVAGFFACGVNLMISLSFFSEFYLAFLCAQFFLFLSIQLFCCLAVLKALKQPGPGERGRERNEENQMKRKAFHIILITTVTMLVLYVLCTALVIPQWISADNVNTILSTSFACFTLAGLVQPLLFLYRVKKLPFMK